MKPGTREEQLDEISIPCERTVREEKDAHAGTKTQWTLEGRRVTHYRNVPLRLKNQVC